MPEPEISDLGTYGTTGRAGTLEALLCAQKCADSVAIRTTIRARFSINTMQDNLLLARKLLRQVVGGVEVNAVRNCRICGSQKQTSQKEKYDATIKLID